MGGDDEASDRSSRRAGDEADAGPARRAPQQPALPSGLEEAEVEMGFEASKAPMHALEAGFGGQERVGYFVEQEEGVKRAVAVRHGERHGVRDQRENVRDGPVERPCAAQRPAEEEAVQRRVVRAAEVVRGEAGELRVGRVPERALHHRVLRTEHAGEGAPILLLLVLVAAVNPLAVSTSSTAARAPGALGRGQLGAVLLDDEHVPAGRDDELEPSRRGSGSAAAWPARS